MRCDACGFELSPGGKFCSECGEAVGDAGASSSRRAKSAEGGPPGSSAERRQLTVLFSDLVGSTAMASRLDPEDWREIVGEYQGACGEAIERFGGYVAQYLGDGVVAYFGYPSAHEDDALRAVRAGLRLIDALLELEPVVSRHGVRLAARVGVHTGTVVVGEIGPSSRKETLALGDTTNVAARLQELASSNTVVLSHSTFRLVRRQFVTEDLGVRALKGISKPTPVYRAIRAKPARTAADSHDALLTPMVGRRQELGLLLDRWELATEARGQVVLICGEAGIGKSRLLRALRDEIGSRDHSWLESRGSSYTEDTALHPVVGLQEDVLGLGALETAEQKLDALSRSLIRLDLGSSENLALFAGLHSLNPAPRLASLTQTPEALRRKTLELLLEWFVRQTDERPVIALFEDLHWLDPTTLEMLARLVERIADRRLLIVATHRPGFHVRWVNLPPVTQILLSRLTRNDAADVARNLETTRGRLDDVLVREIVNRSDGVPLFIEELTKTVLEAELGRSGTAKANSRAIVPLSLRDSLMSRLDQLGTAKDLAQHCAILGREFSLDLIRATAPMAEGELTFALDRLVAAELFQRRGDPPVYAFRHALVQEQAYESLLKATRQTHHRKIAEVLESQFPLTAANQPEVLAHHYDEGGMPEAALSGWLRAGQNSIARSANVEASRQLRRGLDALFRTPETTERDRQELFLVTMRGVALIAVRGYAATEVEQAFARARVLCDHLGDTPHLFPALFGLFLYFLVRGDGRSARELVEQLEAAAASFGEAEYTLEAHTARAALEYWQGSFGACHEHILQARLLYDPQKHAHHQFVYGQDPLAYGYCYGALVYWFQGFPEQALESALKALELAERTNHPLTFAGILSFAADLYYHLREPEAVLSLAERMLGVSAEQGLSLWEAWARTMIGSAKCELGDVSGGITEIEAGLEAFLETGASLNTGYLSARLATACARAGKLEEGLVHVGRALESIERQHDRYYAAELYRLKGEFLRLSTPSQDSLALTAFERALEVSRTQGAKSLELRAAMSLARMRLSGGERDAARELLAGVYGWFTEGLGTRDLMEARALLQSLT